MKILSIIVLVAFFLKGFGQTKLKLFYSDTSQVVFTIDSNDSTDTTYLPKYFYSNGNKFSNNTIYLNDQTVTEIYRDKELIKDLITRINCKGDSVYIKHFYMNANLKRLDIQGKKTPTWFYSEIYYDNGQLRGSCDISASWQSPQLITNYWRNGKKQKEFWVYKGIAINEYKEWYEGGTLKVRGTYADIESSMNLGKTMEEGKWIYWKENGEVEKTLEYINGVLKK